MPAAGHHHGLGAGQEPRHRRKAPLPEADPALAADRARPRALHPLLPLRPLQPGGRRGRTAAAPGARRPTFVGTHEDRPYVGPFHGNIIELCPVGALTITGLPLPRPALGHRGRRLGLHALSEPVQRQASRSATRRSSACSARDNDEVDDGWLCDRGRYGFEMFADAKRVDGPRLQGRCRRRAGSRRSRPPPTGLRGRRRPARSRRSSATPPTRRATSLQRLLREALGSTARRLAPVARGPAASAASGSLSPSLAPTVRGHRRRRRDPRPRHRPAAQLADPRPADPQGDPPQRRQAGRRDRAADRARRRRRGDRPLRPRRAPPLRRRAGRAAVGGAENVATPLAESLRDAGSVVVIWGERIGRDGDAAVAACSASPTPSASPAPRAPACSKSPTSPTPAACARPAACPTPAPDSREIAAGTLDRGDPRGPGVRRDRAASSSSASTRSATSPTPRPGRRRSRPPTSSSAFSMFETATTAKADVLFPLETHAEKDGTVTHPDGRLQRVRPSASRPGDIRPNCAGARRALPQPSASRPASTPSPRPSQP